MEKKKSLKKIVFTIDDMHNGIFAISLVEQPAIEGGFIALSKEEPIKLSVDKKRNMLYGPILIPDIEILRYDKTAKEEYLITFPIETCEMAMHEFMKNKNQDQATFEHQFEIDGVTIVEIWSKEGESDKSVHLGMDYPIGTIFVGAKVDNPDIIEKVEKGIVTGFSIEGHFAQLSKDAQVLAAVEKLLSSGHN